ncbi:MAG: xylulokinase [Candidatus Dormibacter sp.]
MLLGLEVGTTGAWALAIDESGSVVASAAASYRTLTPRPGWTEQDPEDWWAAAQAVLRQVAGEVQGEVTALGLTGQMHGSVFLNQGGAVVRPALLWNDQRTGAQCEEITARVGKERLIAVTGNPALTAFQAPKVLWLRDVEPVQYRHVRRVLLPKDYVRLRLTGELATDVADASGTLLLDLKGRRWSQEILDALEIPIDWLPTVSESATITGGLRPSVAADLGLPTGLPVAAGAGDRAAAAIATGIVRSGVISSSIGTSGVLFAHRDGPAPDPSGRVHTFCSAVPGCYHLMAVTLAAGAVLRWWRDLLDAGVDYDQLAALAGTAPIGADGLFFLPYLSGERTPHRNPQARGAFVGLRAHHTRAHLTRALMEGVIFSLRDGLEMMRGLGVSLERVRATGGGARSQAWRQMQADMFNLPVESLAVDEGPALGAALLAGVAAGVYRDVDDASHRALRLAEVIEPNPEFAARYAQLAHTFKALSSATQVTPVPSG